MPLGYREKKNYGTPERLFKAEMDFPAGFLLLLSPASLCLHREASDQKLKRKDGKATNQLMNAIAVAVSNCAQWFREQLERSLSIRTVMPADAHAAANMRVEVICECNTNANNLRILSEDQLPIV